MGEHDHAFSTNEQLLPSLPAIPRWYTPAPAEKADPEVQDVEAEAQVEEDEDEDLDVPPPFPLPNSSQRSAAPAPIPAPPTAPSLALAPPSPTPSASPPSDLNIAILADPIPLGDMAPPPSTTSRPTFGIKPGGGMEPPAVPSNGGLAPTATPTSTLAPKTTPTTVKPKAKGKKGKVALAPGCSALDWARLTKSGVNLRGTSVPMRVTMEELKKVSSCSPGVRKLNFTGFVPRRSLTYQHKTADDAWSAFNGVVYNITPYLRFHPGGEDELMRVAGRDGTKLFSESTVSAWALDMTGASRQSSRP